MSRRNATRLFIPLAAVFCIGWCGAALADGSVLVTIQPAGAVAAGAKWRLDGGPWQPAGGTLSVSAGMHVVSFKGVPNWLAPPPGTFQVSEGIPFFVDALYTPFPLCEAVGACNRVWGVFSGASGGDGWFPQLAVNHDGHNALRSGEVGPDQSSGLWTEVEGPCTVSFWWKSSCSSGSGQLHCTIDGAPVGAITGETDWTQSTHVLEGGTHQIFWVFQRAAGDPGGGENCGWLDQFLVQESVPPTGSVSINGDAARTSTPDVSLALTYADAGAGVTGMRFSNNGSTWSAWQKPAATRAWSLAPGDGVKTVRAQFRDKAGNVSVRYTDTILLDQTPPTGSILINGGASTADFYDVVLNLAWGDGAGSGVSRMRFSNNGSTWSAWEPVAATKAWTLSGWDYRTVRAQFLDRAGHVSPVCSDYINVVPAP